MPDLLHCFLQGVCRKARMRFAGGRRYLFGHCQTACVVEPHTLRLAAFWFSGCLWGRL